MADPSVQIALVAKADAYGHGIVPVSRYALKNGVDAISVATVQEGIVLRDSGLQCPIYVLSPILPIEADQAVFYDLEVFVESLVTGLALSEASERVGKSAHVHIKVDTGLARFGVKPEDALGLAKELRALPGVEVVGLAQHFADSYANAEFTRCQLDRFEESIDALRAEGFDLRTIQAANSAAAVNMPESRFNMVRLGIIAYGIDPYDLLGGEAQAVMRLKSRVTSLRDLPEGATVGYSCTYTVDRPTKLATVGIGYGDGYSRHLSSKADAWVRGARARVLGLVCMDQTMIDVTDIPGVEVGDVVEMFGEHVHVPELARLAGTNSHEIVTRIMSRVPRRYEYG